MKPPRAKLTLRALRDLRDCIDFISRHPRGKPVDRFRDICRGVAQIRLAPKAHAARVYRAESGLHLRCHTVAQFAIVYAYLDPSTDYPDGLVSIRAIRHRRVRDVFWKVKEGAPPGESFEETSNSR
jgi:plasmid stabilization system protein ParE